MDFGLIGKKLGHSYSQGIHNQIGNYKYELKEIAPENLDAFFTEKNFKGLNVTIPYKQDVIKHLYEISDEAKEIGSVNTVVNKNGNLYGYNTDCHGLTALINHARIDLNGKKVLILGTGGTSKTATYVAKKLGAKEILHVSRHESEGCITYQQAAELHQDAQIIINTTPSGMFPETSGKPIDITPFKNLSGIVDVIYNPLCTNLVLDGLKRDIPSTGGLYMLVAQAVYASAFFFDKEVDVSLIDKIYNSLISEKKNIVLIGMPSCGKTTVGNELSKTTGKKLIDIDSEIVKKINMPIAQFFEENGEAAFRKIEAETVKEFSSVTNSIISTGGGCILNPENINYLKQNGTVYFINRSLENLITTDDRPLSSSREALKKRFDERYNIYIDSCDVEIDGNKTVKEVADSILKKFGEIK